jgi:hypothetical protein
MILIRNFAMARRSKSETKHLRNRFYHSAKISEYQFKRVLWSFVLDEPVAEAAKHIDLSANSINAIYAKLRVYFTALGVFKDIYEGGDPKEGTPKGEDYEGFEFRLLSFHLERAKGKRRMKDVQIGEINYNWNESFWRFHYSILTDGRPSEAVHRMMYAHLLAQIRLCGPVGAPPKNLEESARLNDEHFKQRIRWLERNSPAFKDEASRTALREFRERPLRDATD